MQAIDEVAQLEEAGERLKLLLVCTHPALDPAIRTPLMLQVVLGIDAARIASAFLVARAAMSQRLVRAKSKIREARIPFTIPAIEDLPDRLEAVFEAVYAAFSLVWDAAPGSDHAQRGLVNEAIALARLLVRLLPKEPEAMGLLALMLHCEARREARRNIHGHYVPLADQDRALWSLPMIAEAESLLRLTATSNAPGRFQWEAAIQSAHNLTAAGGTPPLREIGLLHRELLARAPSVGGCVAYAAALLQGGDAHDALEVLEGLPTARVLSFQPFWVVRASVMKAIGRENEARDAAQRAIGLTQDDAIRQFLLETHRETKARKP